MTAVLGESLFSGAITEENKREPAAPVPTEPIGLRPSWDHDAVGWYLKSARLPKMLAPYERFICAARESRLPVRRAPWRSYEQDGRGRPLESGTRDDDANIGISLAAKNWLLCFERSKEALSDEAKAENENRAAGYLAALRRECDQAAAVLDAMEALEAATAAYLAAAQPVTLAPRGRRQGVSAR